MNNYPPSYNASNSDQKKANTTMADTKVNHTDAFPIRLSIERSVSEPNSNTNEAASAPPVSPGLGFRAPGPCAECGLRINNIADACHAMGYLYHNSCFVCCYCQRTLSGKVFYRDQEKIYCEEDYLYCGFQQTAEKCALCGHLIAETILQALGKTYHPGCFRCCVCTKCLDGVPFAVDSQNLPYCASDYYLIHSPRCGACGQIITPEEGSDEVIRVVALDREFHVDCYRCCDCKKLLGDEHENRCYPMTGTNTVGTDKNCPQLLCLSCHLLRIGAVPATVSSPTSPSHRPGVTGRSTGTRVHSPLTRLSTPFNRMSS